MASKSRTQSSSRFLSTRDKWALLPLTEKEKKVLQFITSYWDEHGTSPSYQEIQQALGYRSINSIQNFIKQLRAKHYLTQSERHKRSLKLTELQKEVGIPILGRVAAGKPLEFSSELGRLEFYPNKPGNFFALQVVGFSMIEEWIFDGDWVVVRKSESVGNGDLVVASVDDAATIKRFYRREQGESSIIELKAANPDFASQFYSFDRVRIEGVVSHLIRKF
jgi:repressor LexA